jgi:hypothetical protein
MLKTWLPSHAYLSSITRLLAAHPSISLNIIGQPIIWTADPTNFRKIFAGRSDNFERSGIMQKAFAPLIPNGLVMANGQAVATCICEGAGRGFWVV